MFKDPLYKQYHSLYVYKPCKHNDVLVKCKPSEFPVNLNMYEIKIETRNKSSVSPFKILI